MPRSSPKVENPFEPLVDAWRRSCDAGIQATAKTLESTLTSKEFLEMSRHSLELMCGHRDQLAAMAEEFLEIPARPTMPRKAGKQHGRRKR